MAQAMRPRWGKANEEEKGMTEPPKRRRTLDPSKWKPLSQADLDRIYGPHGLSIYSPVRPRRTSNDEREAGELSRKDEAVNEGTHE